MSYYKIAILPGDGIGPEVIKEAVLILEEVAKHFHHTFEMKYGLIGGVAVDKTGTPLPTETVELCKNSDAILLGAVGGPKWDQELSHRRPEAGLLGIRKTLNLYANLRPVTLFDALLHTSPLKSENVIGTDVLIVRELTGGIYFGTPRERKNGENGQEAIDTLRYSEKEIERILRQGFQIAQGRKKKLTSVDKANVLESSRLWREVADRLSYDYPDVKLEHMLVDNVAMQLIRNPRQFDVIVTENMFGDILSDEASMLTGSLGMLPSASLSDTGPGLYEPIHGSAPDIAGKDKANPLATILSVAMLLRHSLRLENEADSIENAVKKTLEAGYRTGDIGFDWERVLTTTQMGTMVRSYLKSPVQNG
ncbi:3-isopropylmalate dehydrogenase [Sutcliffiella rhizosphaerae]|uniref:3-isopropylmalate dehydrogenase n=1 Tax=Sutcliffiella rhizosphaerae TaxID=2880967 RepID=A0ABN8A9Y1_9BACI|nr:3-isopropylmalate dehydrogenase [Sutcliffiella rhizosphaerae]CAG9620676.1 3-isopropylmalate dehydrogenase [Sutcliffiella rhizosphaerae]